MATVTDIPIVSVLSLRSQVSVASDQKTAEPKMLSDSHMKQVGVGDTNINRISYHKLFQFASTGEIMIFLAGIASAVASSGITVYFIISFSDIMGTLLTGDREGTTEIVFTFAKLACVGFVVSWTMSTTLGIFAEKQKLKFKIKYLESLMHQDIAWFDTHDVGVLPEQMTSNLEAIANGLGEMSGLLSMNVSLCIISFTCGFAFWWELGLIICVTLPLIAFGTFLTGKAASTIHIENQSWYAGASAVAEEVLNGIRTVVSFRCETTECQRYESMLKRARCGGIVAQLKMGLGTGCNQLIMMCSYGITFCVAALFVSNGATKSDGSPYNVQDVLKALFCFLSGGGSLGFIAYPLQAVAAACGSTM
jgi:ATP-binding cassette subfamily B (MDR/TAP) protein 1